MSAFECVCVSGKTAKLISFFSLLRLFLKLAKYETLHLYFREVLTLGFRDRTLQDHLLGIRTFTKT